MGVGAYEIAPNWEMLTISFVLRSDLKDGVPEDQALLEAEIRDFVVAMSEFRPRQKRSLTAFERKVLPMVNDHFKELVEIAKLGLTGESAQPKYALQRLEWLEKSYFTIIVSRLQRRYIQTMGRFGFLISIVCLALYFLFQHGAGICDILGVSQEMTFDCLSQFNPTIFPLLISTVIGTWVSYASRPQVIKIDDLDARQVSRGWGGVQFVTVALISLILAFLLSKEVIVFEVGKLAGKNILIDPLTALCFGALFGLTERTLPSQLVARASKLLEKRI